MVDTPHNPPRPTASQPGPASDAREARRAEALRANLRRRKAVPPPGAAPAADPGRESLT